MKKKISYYIFGIFFTAFLCNWLAQKQAFHIPWIHAYMDDLICIPVILFPLMFAFRRWIFPTRYFVFPVSYIVTVWVLLSLVFEVYLPQKKTIYTSDPLDMVLYALGGVVFYFMQKPFSAESRQADTFLDV